MQCFTPDILLFSISLQLREEVYSELCNTNQVAGVKVRFGHMAQFKVCEFSRVSDVVAEVSKVDPDPEGSSSW